MIILNAVQRQTGDKISLKDSILTINNIEFDLNNLSTDNTKKVYKLITPIFEDDKQTGETVDTIINIEVDKNHFFMFHSGNAKRFYDINCNGILELNELSILINDYNADSKTCKANRKLIYDKFVKTGTKKEWIAKGL